MGEGRQWNFVSEQSPKYGAEELDQAKWGPAEWGGVIAKLTDEQIGQQDNHAAAIPLLTMPNSSDYAWSWSWSLCVSRGTEQGPSQGTDLKLTLLNFLVQAPFICLDTATVICLDEGVDGGFACRLTELRC